MTQSASGIGRIKPLAALTLALVLIATLFTAAVHSTPAQARTKYDDQIEQARKQKAALDAEAKDLKTKLTKTNAELAEVVSLLKVIEGDLLVAQAERNQAQAILKEAERAYLDLQSRLADAVEQEQLLVADIAATDEKIAEIRTNVTKLARFAYRNGNQDSSSILQLVLQGSSPESLDSLEMADRALRAQRSVLDDLGQQEAKNNNAKARLEAVREDIAALTDQAKIKLDEATAAKKVADAALRKVEGLLSKQRNEQARLQRLQTTLQVSLDENDKARDASAKLISDLGRKRQQEIDRQNQQNGNSGGGGGSGGAIGRGFLDYPTKNVYVTSSYGMRIHPVYGYARLHAGTDFRAYCGTPIYAAAAGKVEWARRMGGYGNQVLIDHGSVQGKHVMTNYNHLSRFAVSGGQRVSKGQLVGYSGNTGTSTACHLHFEVYINGSTVNPMSVL